MSPKKVSFVPEVAGSHGSSTLWPTTEGNDAYWVAVEDFLEYWPLSDTGDLIDDNEPREMKLRFTGPCVVEVSSNLEKWSALFYNDDKSTLTWSPKSSESLFFRSRAGQENLFDPAHVINVSTNGSAGSYSFNVTVSSEETGCEQYADWWEVLDESGNLLYRRVLAHCHVTEQPFTRSGGSLDIQEDSPVWIRAHMNTTGYGGNAYFGSVAEGFEETELPTTFAPWGPAESLLPNGCDFSATISLSTSANRV
jgi:hypothetical protein